MSTISDPGPFARELLHKLDLKPPIDVFFICDNFNIIIKNDKLRDFEAVFILHKGAKKIVLNENINYETRKNFTIAHEIGHYILPWHKQTMYICDSIDIQSFQSKKSEEVEANRFAAELLIPTEYLLDDIKNKEINIALIKQLAEKYKVSLTSIGIRIVENTYNPIALVLSENGKIKWSIKSKSFLKKILPNGTYLREQSFAFDFFNGNCIPAGPQMVYSIGWLENGSFYEYIKEESLQMPNLNMVLTLLTFENQEEEFNDNEFDDW
ncbi:MAG: ImmA/IrrE family metallo-endopeptidase [Thermoanaerobacter sp.]|jgi:Zn-dependent peptidase ImmA (M78 family)|uniref:ImmA/IrrE family metallo-endopeptidase n=1 Tax=Thermoanaerobacter sp. TaxID=1755 RepID=UPI0008EF448E|nr:ImmA/IrrE family metallo-endopeptidase [Thermoanaerobacter sp.]SFE62591.1 protein of unknown function [Thermoanaerobacter thermohydrosulfuricus]